jgi:regulatory protein
MARGVEGALADELIAASGEDWDGHAAAVRRKRFGAELPADFAQRARQRRFLEYRGFAPAQMRHAMAGDVDD